MSHFLHTTPESLLEALDGFFLHHTSQFYKVDALTDAFLQAPAAISVQSYDSPWRGWHHELVYVCDALYATIALEKGKLSELRTLLTKQTRAHKLGVLAELLAA